ncbi:hypothetical protein TNCV_1711371 [Trichonephila clavipes]|nr:hypothetical protein TNCV_1711371 [Trichonephila clavipes]
MPRISRIDYQHVSELDDRIVMYQEFKSTILLLELVGTVMRIWNQWIQESHSSAQRPPTINAQEDRRVISSPATTIDKMSHRIEEVWNDLTIFVIEAQFDLTPN